MNINIRDLEIRRFIGSAQQKNPRPDSRGYKKGKKYYFYYCIFSGFTDEVTVKDSQEIRSVLWVSPGNVKDVLEQRAGTQAKKAILLKVLAKVM